MRKTITFLAVALMSLAFAAPVYAQTATEEAYSGAAGAQDFSGGEGEAATAGGNSGDPAAATSASSSDSSSDLGVLPFTGLELALIAIAGLALVGTGLMIRRATRRSAEL